MWKKILAKLSMTKPYRATFLVAPEYDSVTRETCDWLRLRVPLGIQRYVFLGKHGNRRNLENALQESSDLDKLIVFLGHGDDDALLGPPLHDGSDVQVDGQAFSRIYDSTMMGANRNALFAFCCKAGIKLGPQFARSEKNSFLGFDSNVFLILDDEDRECTNVWKSIIRTVSHRVIKDGEISAKHVQLLRKLYDKYLMYFQQGKGKNNRENAFYMILTLSEQRASLRRY